MPFPGFEHRAQFEAGEDAMSTSLSIRLPDRRWLTAAGILTMGLLLAAPAKAQHRARLSTDLAQDLAKHASGIRVLVQTPRAEVDRLAATYHLTVVKTMNGGAVMTGTAEQIDLLASDENVASLREDGHLAGTMAVSTESTGAKQVWAGNGTAFGGITGLNVGVAVIDSGIATQHPDVKNRVSASFDCTDSCKPTNGGDDYGHGTFIASVIAGSGKAGSDKNGKADYIGMAPGATLVSMRVLGADGSGYVSDAITAIDFAIENREKLGLRILNLSLGHLATERYQDDLLAQAAERAVKA